MVDRERVLDAEELRALWLACDEVGYPLGDTIRLLILTGQRRSEVANARWEEFGDDGIWRIPASRSKNKKQHSVPLSSQAREIIKSLPRVSDEFLFSTDGRTPCSNWSKRKKLLPALAEPWTLHDLRRTCATGLQKLGVPLPVTEKILNHVAGSHGGIVGVYQKYDYENECAASLQRWADRVEEIVAGRKADNVVRMAR